MKPYIVILLLLFSFKTYGWILDVDQVYVDAFKYEVNRDPYMPEEKLKYGADFNLNLRILKYIFWENSIHFTGSDSQIREGGWKFRAGVPLFTPQIEAFYFHHSRHIMERERDSKAFPQKDAVGIRLYFKR